MREYPGEQKHLIEKKVLFVFSVHEKAYFCTGLSRLMCFVLVGMMVPFPSNRIVRRLIRGKGRNLFCINMMRRECKPPYSFLDHGSFVVEIKENMRPIPEEEKSGYKQRDPNKRGSIAFHKKGNTHGGRGQY